MIEILKDLGLELSWNPIIEQAFVHSSYVQEQDIYKESNERLEFIGDAVLQLWTSEQIFSNFKLDEGPMTVLRSQIVCEASLASYARSLGLNKYLKLGKGEEKTGGRDRTSIVADLFEAFLGAMYIAYGKQVTDQFLTDKIYPYIMEIYQGKYFDNKTKLQEFVQTDVKNPVKYQVVETQGPPNNPTFVVHVGIGEGKNKKAAEQAAAEDALMKMVK
jgi:ribonuclease III